MVKVKNKTEDHEHLEEMIVGGNPMLDVNARSIYLSGPINVASAHNVVSALNTLERINPKMPIRIVLNSHGGFTDAGYAIYDAIRFCKCFVLIDVFGTAYSIAALILQAGDLRRMSENSEFMIHNGILYPGTDGIQSNDIPKINFKNAQENQKYQKSISNRSGQPFNKIKNWCDAETFFDPKDCLRFGFIDQIIKPTRKDTGFIKNVKSNKKG